MESPSGSESRGLSALAGAMLGLALVLLIGRYGGINHDASLYLGQALLQRWPEIFGSDLFFVHGSQGRYTLLPLLVASAFDWLDPAWLFLIGALAGVLLFAWAGWYCLRGLLPAPQRHWAWLGVLCLPSMYGRTAIFSYGEPFLTPRAFSEAMCLLGLGLLARRRWTPAVACALAAGLLHPLQTLGAALVVWPWAVMQDRRWLHAAWLAVPAALLAWAGIQPFDGLFRSIDPAWLGALRDFTSQVFLARWAAVDYVALGFDVFVLGCAWRAFRDAFGDWCAASLFGLALGLAASLVLVDGLHLVLPAGLQTWRVHWLAHWFAMAAIALLLQRDLRAGDPARALCLALAGSLAWGGTRWSWLAFAVLYASWPLLSGQLTPRFKTLLCWLFGLGLALLFANYVAFELLPFRMAHYRLDLYAFDRRVLAYPFLALALALLGLRAWHRLAQRGRWALVALVLLPLVVAGAARWDARSPIAKAVERNAFRTDLFGTALPESAQVYWDDDTLVGTWLALHRASYFNVRQVSGVVFNRGTAMEARARLDRISLVIRESLFCQDRSTPVERRAHCRISERTLRHACTPGPWKRPDYLVLPYLQRQRALGSWSIVDPVTGDAAVTYYLYACAGVIDQMDGAKRAAAAGRPAAAVAAPATTAPEPDAAPRR